MNQISKVSNRLWVSGDPVYSEDLASDYNLAETMDVIVDLRCQEEKDTIRSWGSFISGPRHVWVEMFDDLVTKNSYQRFGVVLDKLQDIAITKNKRVGSLKVMVHCHMGVNRAPSVGMYLLLALDRRMKDPWTAFRTIREHRPQAFIAYAAQAVEAWLHLHEDFANLMPFEYQEQLDAWTTMEKKYWQVNKKEIRKINNVIQRNNLNQGGQAAVDELGRLHVQGSE